MDDMHLGVKLTPKYLIIKILLSGSIFSIRQIHIRFPDLFWLDTQIIQRLLLTCMTEHHHTFLNAGRDWNKENRNLF